MRKSKLKKVIGTILLFIIFMETMYLRIYAAELELESKYGSGNPYKFEISDTWTSKGEAMRSYDVSKQGQIAIAFDNYTIGVFDNDMNFLYQLSFKTNGTYGVLWFNEKLLFIEVRSNTAIVCDKDGMPENFYQITGPINYYYDIVKKRVRKQGNDEYYSIKKGGSNAPDSLITYGSYTMLKRISKEGEEEILYETEKTWNKEEFMLFGMAALVVAVNILVRFAIFTYGKRVDKRNK